MFAETFERLCIEAPDALAVLEADTGTAWTRRELAAAASRMERLLAPERARRIAVHLPSGIDFLAALLAIWRCDRCAIPIDAELTSDAARDTAERLGAALLMEPDALHPVDASPVGAGTPEFLIKVTSGSTGMARGVALSAAALDAGLGQIVSTMGLRPEDRTLVSIPLSHSYAFDNAVLMLLRLGSPILLVKDRTPTRLADLARRSGATVWPAVPVLLDLLARAPGADGDAFAEHRLVISAGAPLPKATRESFAARFGIRPRNFYGSSECGGIAFDREGAADLADGCVGVPLDGVSVELEGQDDSGIGRVRVLGASVGSVCLPRSDPDLDGGRFRTGDLGRFDADGRLCLVGRVGEEIDVGARKVHPAEVEGFLLSLPGVREAVVLAAERNSPSSALRAVVVGEGLEVGTLRTSCEAALASWKVPRRIEIRSELPRNARGKVDRGAL